MTEVVLDTSVLIGLCFRHAGERAACASVIPQNSTKVCSRYALFELARGFLRSLIDLHNLSFEFDTFADFHQAAHSGQLRFRPYRMHTWLGAFDDYFAALAAADGDVADPLKLEEFRAKLRGWIRRGWQRVHQEFLVRNECGCRDDLPSPTHRVDQRIEHDLPTSECGAPSACGLQQFVDSRRSDISTIKSTLAGLTKRDPETEDRISALLYLLTIPVGTAFEGRRCFDCGDALICLDAPKGGIVVTKNKKHFEPITSVLGQTLNVAVTASSTRAED